jgi:hypothetical protein
VAEKKTKKGQANKNATIYSYTLHYRYRWGLPMISLQLLMLVGLFVVAKQYFYATNTTILNSLGHLVILWILQGFSFFLYCYTSSLPFRWHIDALLSPWGGWRTKNHLSISDYQQIEWLFFCFGIGAGLLAAAWWQPAYGFLLLSFHLTLSIPRIVTIFRVQKWKQARNHYIIKHERQGVGLYSTSG